MNIDVQKNFAGILNILNRNKRFQAVFLLLLRQANFINSTVLSAEIKISPRTVKSDIKLLKEKIENYGITIFSRPFYGYKLIIEHEELHFLLKQYFQISQPVTINNKFESRINTILRHFLSADQPLKIEDLQNELYLSFNSSLLKELNQVRKQLDYYGLKLVSKPYHGMQIVGENYRKIMLTVRMYKYFNQSEHQFGIKNFENLFHCPFKQEIRHLFARTITGFNVVFSDIYAERFIIYLCYFYNQQPNLALPQIDFDYKQTNEYQFIVKLLTALSDNHIKFNFNEETVRFLTYIAISSTDLYRFKDCCYENYHNLIYQAEALHQTVLRFFSENLNLQHIDDETCRKDLLKMLIPIRMKMLLKVSDDIDLGLYHQREIQHHPILHHQINKLFIFIEKKYQYRFSIRE